MLSRGNDVTYVAGDEDGEVVWFGRTARWPVRRQAAADWCTSLWLIAATAAQRLSGVS